MKISLDFLAILYTKEFIKRSVKVNYIGGVLLGVDALTATKKFLGLKPWEPMKRSLPLLTKSNFGRVFI